MGFLSDLIDEIVALGYAGQGLKWGRKNLPSHGFYYQFCGPTKIEDDRGQNPQPRDHL
jgi:hypothetical protein